MLTELACAGTGARAGEGEGEGGDILVREGGVLVKLVVPVSERSLSPHLTSSVVGSTRSACGRTAELQKGNCEEVENIPKMLFRINISGRLMLS